MNEITYCMESQSFLFFSSRAVVWIPDIILDSTACEKILSQLFIKDEWCKLHNIPPAPSVHCYLTIILISVYMNVLEAFCNTFLVPNFSKLVWRQFIFIFTSFSHEPNLNVTLTYHWSNRCKNALISLFCDPKECD